MYLYSYLMPKEVRERVDRIKDCEDIAMNFLAAHLSRKPPMKVCANSFLKCVNIHTARTSWYFCYYNTTRTKYLIVQATDNHYLMLFNGDWGKNLCVSCLGNGKWVIAVLIIVSLNYAAVEFLRPLENHQWPIWMNRWSVSVHVQNQLSLSKVYT